VILKDLTDYLRSKTSLTPLVGNKIYPTQAPTNAVMPWLIVEITAGVREQLTVGSMAGTAFARLTVDVGPGDAVKGSTLIHAVLALLENYRGDMGDTKDVYITCTEPRNWPGMGGVFRYQFDATIDYIDTLSRPS